MSPRKTSNAIVVGAGIVGAACAAALSRDGWGVTVVDKQFAAAGTTSVGMGHLVAMDDSPDQLALTEFSIRLWRALRPELDSRAELDPCGTLWLAEDDAQMAAVHEKQRVYAAAGVRSEILGSADVAAAEPNLRSGLAGALLVPDDAVVYPPGATVQLLELAQRNGSVVRQGVDVREIVDRGVRCATESLEADIVVNAAGAAAPSLTKELPIVPRKGHLAITDRYPQFCHHQLVELGYLASAHKMTSESVAFNVQPRSTGQVLIGSSRELVGWDASLNDRLLREMLARAVQLMPALRDVSVIRCWTGFRPATPDKLPLIGAWTPVEGLFIATGHEGLGITTSLATAELVADTAAGRPSKIDATAFSPMRVFTQSAKSSES
jgi:glycine/D-amino acid oxidase-like deaminating enzyme